LKNKDDKPNLYIIAGPNGAGKTTFARKFLPDYMKCLEFVNVDLIANGISPFDPDRAFLRAHREWWESRRWGDGEIRRGINEKEEKTLPFSIQSGRSTS
jgi:predicted ABC-type ATPase